MISLSWAALIAALAMFAIVAWRGVPAVTGTSSFFHVDGLRRNVLSLGIADITLGTGLVYVLTASSQLGLWMLLPPLGLVLGYYSLAMLFRGPAGEQATKSGNLLLAVRDRLSSPDNPNGRKGFDALITLPLIVTYLLFVSYEVFASSQVIAAFVSPGSGLLTAAAIGGAIILVSGMNSILGGMQANWRNDKILAAGILLLVFVVVVASFSSPVPPAATLRGVFPELTLPLAAALALAFINAFATQLYSLLNLYNGSNFSSAESAAKSYIRVGIVVALVLGSISLIGALRPLDLAQGLPAALSARLDALQLPAGIEILMKIVTVFGMAAVVFSTCDTLMLALAYFIKRQLLNQATDDATVGANVTLARDRVLVAALFFGIIPPLAAFYLTNPDLFTLLLSIAGAAAVFAPMVLFNALSIGKSHDGSRFGARWQIPAFFTLFCLTSIGGAFLTLTNPAMLPYMNLLVILISTAMAIWTSGILYRSR